MSTLIRYSVIAVLLLSSGLLVFDLVRSSTREGVAHGSARPLTVESTHRSAAAIPVERAQYPADQSSDDPDLSIAAEPKLDSPSAPESTAWAPPPAFISPREGGRSVERSSLAGRVRGLLQHANLRQARVGIAVVSATTNESVLTHNAERSLIVASNAKLLTTAAAVELLGPDFSFDTYLLSESTVDEEGVLRGNLIVRGSGDPDLRVAGRPAKETLLGRLVKVARDSGIERVTGRLLVDDCLFDRQYVAPGWDPGQLNMSYFAPVAGFSLFQNCVAIHVKPAEKVGQSATVWTEPQTSVFDIRSRVTTGSRKQRHLIDVIAPVGPGIVNVRGKTPAGKKPYPVTVPVRQPAMTAGLILRDALLDAGVQVDGGVELASRRYDPTARGVVTLGKASNPFMDALVEMNKESSNVIAEHLFKLAGHAHEGLGSFESGGRAVQRVLLEYGVQPYGSESADGSGLSRGNRYAPIQLARLLAALYRSDVHRPVLLRSLPEAGTDGTLARRLTGNDYRGRVRAKTGYIWQVSALSGFAQTNHGEVLAFSILFNGYAGRNAEMKKVQNSIVELLIDLAE